MFGTGACGDFARAAGLAFCAAAAAAAGANHGWLCDVKAVACVNLDAGGGQLIPAAKLGEGDTEAIGNGDEGVAAAGGVVDGMCGGGSGGRDRYYEGLDAIEFSRRFQLICAGKGCNGDAVGVSDRGQRVSRGDLVISP